MIRYTQGNLLDAEAEAVVNTVNEVGVMGKGIALMFREAFQENYAAYAAACARSEVQVGHMFVTQNYALTGPKWIINFPTKKHWRHPTKFDWVEDGLKDLRQVIEEKQIRSIAIPPLGCGNGGLEWKQVRSAIESALRDLSSVDILVYEPTSKYQNAAKREGVLELTPARALMAEMVRRYWVLGIECTYLEVQKLGWFLERSVVVLHMKDPLDLRFQADKYGPYSVRLRHLLNGLDGSYLHCTKRLSDAGPMDTIWFEEEHRSSLQQYMEEGEGKPFLLILEHTSKLIDGFESPLGMELLATVDWLLRRERYAPNLDSIKKGLHLWPGGESAGQRKLKLFDDRILEIALKRLSEQPV